MELKARGWGRNMGNTTIADINLGELKVRREANKPVHFDNPALFDVNGEISIAWGKKLHLGGDYRLQMDFSYAEVAKMFRAAFGSKLTPEILEQCGLTLSDDLQKSALSKVKVADLTLGDLAKMVMPAAEEASTETPEVVPFRRRL
ncbi:hypothetical protein [Bradyrhizobium diazoefficiens]|nr:hypothetical protein [Bradyrhizobium diazoefficiens]AND90228.1 hypothetical protein AAV28_22390 [Bradyrhizobium diazoefficiens USDA 110]BCF44911.1 hypothetical protein XF16B_54010 [Bradyrhizobium diazoefficiens]BCF71059.1 hypothetical protein XF19B_54120 [Bradyrhizobium diazoefficiens]